MSRIAVIGDVHGRIDLMIERALTLGAENIIQVGDFGTFAVPEQLDKATRRHDGLGDFPDYYRGVKHIPIPTHFIKGNHEDFDIIEEIADGTVPNLHYMRNGQVYDIDGLRVGALGGNYSPARFPLDRSHPKLRGSKRKHFNHQDVNNLLHAGGMDVLITHDCPIDVGFMSKYDGRPCGSPEIRELIETVQPMFCFHGHYHRYNEARISNTRVIGLGIIHGTTQSLFMLEP